MTAVFDSPQSSSNGGSLLLKAGDAALGLTESLASWLRDGRQSGKVVHGLRVLLRQRVFAIACGYADGNHASRRRKDPVFKLLAGRDPDQGRDLASQPTLSCFENSIRRRDLLEAAKAFAAAVIERQASMTLDEMLEELPKACDIGVKSTGKGYLERWTGYKLHLDAIDGGIPISCLLTAASVHDSQAAIPLATLTASRVTSLYDLMDSAYDAPEIRAFSQKLGHVPIIDVNPRRRAELKAERKREALAERSEDSPLATQTDRTEGR